MTDNQLLAAILKELKAQTKLLSPPAPPKKKKRKLRVVVA